MAGSDDPDYQKHKALLGYIDHALVISHSASSPLRSLQDSC